MKYKVVCAILSIVFILTSCGSVASNNDVEQTDAQNKATVNLELHKENNVAETEIDETEIEDVIEPVSVSIAFFGDDLIHEPLLKQAKQDDGTYNFDKQFSYIDDYVKTFDYAILNQETIIIDNNIEPSSYPTFGTPCSIVDSIINAGFDMVSCATNHSADKGSTVLQKAAEYYDNCNNLDHIGIHSESIDNDYIIKNVNGINIAFVNYTYGLNGLEERVSDEPWLVDRLSDDNIEATMQTLSDERSNGNVDVIVAILHSGDEYTYEPNGYQQEQIDRMIDNGADIVFNTHPHVMQPYEFRGTASGNRAVVFYSTGNFISGQTEIPRILGCVATVQINKDGNEISYNPDIEYIVTHQEANNYYTKLLSEYTDEEFSHHKLYGKDNITSVDELQKFAESICYNRE